jgi:hypothetical protein
MPESDLAPDLGLVRVLHAVAAAGLLGAGALGVLIVHADLTGTASDCWTF